METLKKGKLLTETDIITTIRIKKNDITNVPNRKRLEININANCFPFPPPLTLLFCLICLS